jgi:HK97 family phage major capsid protein
MQTEQMNTLVKAKREILEGLVGELDTLLAKGVLSDAELKRLGDLPQLMDEATKSVNTCMEADKAAAAAKGFLGGGGPAPISNDTAQALAAQAALEGIVSKAIGSRTTWLEKSGTSTFGWDPSGKTRPIEGDGWSVDDPTFKAIQEPVYMKSYGRYLRGFADTSDFKTLEVGKPPRSAKALSEGADSGGGYLVPPEYMARLIMREPHPSRIMSYIDTVPCSSDQVIWPRVNNDSDTTDIYSANEPRIQWIGEKGPTPSQADITFGNVTVQVYTGQFYVEVSRNLVEDAHISISQIVGMFGGQAYTLGLDNAVVSGNGIGQPTGLLTNAGAAGDYCPTINCGNPVSAAGLINLVEGMPPQYSDSESTVAIMNKINAWSTFAQIEDQSGQLIFGLARTQGPEGLASPRVHRLLGYPVIFSAFWPNTGAGNNVLGFGDPKSAYVFCQRVGMTIETYGLQDRGMIQKNQIGWNFRFRCGGQVVQNRAFHVGVQS